MIPHTPDNLEASVNRVLRSLPDRRAPAGLEARVLAEAVAVLVARGPRLDDVVAAGVRRDGGEARAVEERR